MGKLFIIGIVLIGTLVGIPAMWPSWARVWFHVQGIGVTPSIISCVAALVVVAGMHSKG